LRDPEADLGASTVNTLQAAQLKDHGSIPGGRKRFFLRKSSRPVLGPVEPHILLVPGAGTRGRGLSDPGTKQITKAHLVVRLRIN
jgi:hypothetical protein